MVKFYTPQVSTLKNGKFKVYIRYSDPSFLGIKNKSKVIPKNTAMARQKAIQEIKNKITNSLHQTKVIKITFKEVSERYLAALIKTSAHNSTINSRTSIFNVANKTFGEQIISSISYVELNHFFDDLLYKSNLTNSTVSGYRSAFSELFKYAKKFGYIIKNPMTEIDINYKDESAKKQERIDNYYLSDDEFYKVLEYCLIKKRKDYYNLFYWLYLTGMRIGEATALTPKDIFVEDDITYAKVTGTMIYTSEKGWHKQDTTKTIAGTRNVALPLKAVEIYQDAIKDKNNPTEFLFYSFYNNHPFNPRSSFFFLQRLQNKFGLRHFGTHIFRHTHISKLAEKGYSLELISKRVGHHDSEVTRRIYYHITKKAQKKFDEQIKNLKI